jgi:hypothetical protein
VTERIRDRGDRPVPEFEPGARRRLDTQEMRERDAAVARLRRQRVPFRVIAERLGMSLGSVQKSVRRHGP